MHPALQPFRLGSLELRNRIIKAATFETRADAGLVTDALVDWHRRFAAGGVAMSTLSYCSVSSDGRTFRDQVWMREEALPGLARFAAAMHAEGAAAAVQLGHAGWFADPRATGTRPLGPSATFSPHARARSRAMTEADLDRVEADFVRAAELAVAAGIDGIEVHLGHGYLLSQFLCPFNNRRRDAWGGSPAARARYPRRVMAAVHRAVGGRAAVWAKLNMEDGFRGGMTLDEGLEVARLLAADASVDALQLTGGHTARSPMFLMRGDSPMGEFFAQDPSLVRRTMMGMIVRLLIRDWPFSEAWFLESARRFRQAVDLPLMLLGGLTRSQSLATGLAEGFELLAIGRALLAEPDLVRRLEAGAWTASPCTHCNQCVARVGHAPTDCVLQGGC